jgi:hypothetical protein
MTKFIELIPFVFGNEPGVKAPVTINVNCIKAVFLDENTTLAKILVSDEVKEFFEEQLTDNKFMYVVEPTYEEIAKILTQKEVREQNNMNK